jgi:penicillin-binding protein 1A
MAKNLKSTNKKKHISSRNKKHTTHWKRRLIKYLLVVFLLSITAVSGLFLSVYWGLWGKLPSYSELENIQNSQATKVFSDDEKLIGKYYYKFNRTNVHYNDISKHAIDALIATEDSRFYQHSGVDKRSLLRVFFKTLLLGDRSSGGGSTLSQQLCKNLYSRSGNIIVSKFKEAITATRLEKIYSKKEILALYLNTVPFGEGTYGIESASQRYFNKHAKELNLPEAATLIGMLKANTAYNPRLYPENALRRRNVVINQMVKYGVVKSKAAKNYKKTPLNIDYRRLDSNTGPATYLREGIRQEIIAFLKKYEEENGKKYNVYKDGLNIYTTLNSDLQKYAEEAVQEHMKSLQHSFYNHWKNRDPWSRKPKALKDAIKRTQRYKTLKSQGKTEKEIQKIFRKKVKMEIYSPYKGDRAIEMSPLDSVKHYLKILHTGFIAIDPRNGKVRAWVGGLDHKYFKYDMVKAKRQTGSVFKPIVYATALENGESPKTYYEDKQKEYKEFNNWSPRNSHNHYGGYYTMKGALAQSINTIAVDLAVNNGIDTVINLAHNMGIESEITPYPSMALGVSNISLYEMVQPYCIFANNGIKNKPYYISKITDKSGNILFERKQSDEVPEQIISRENANLISYMLESVVNEGTATRLRGRYRLTNAMAGKTGTTQNNVDGWFIGYNPHIVAGCRVGAEDERIHFRTTSLGQGANTALPIFALFMKKALKDSQFKYWQNLQFPSISHEEEERMNIPPFKDKLNFIEKISNEKLKFVKKKKEEKKKRRNIFDRIKNIFRKKK